VAFTWIDLMCFRSQTPVNAKPIRIAFVATKYMGVHCVEEKRKAGMRRKRRRKGRWSALG